MTHYTLQNQNPKRQQYRALRYKRQRISALIAQTHTKHAVSSCMLSSAGNEISVMYDQSTGHACYNGLITCGSVWDCPICSAKIGAKRRDELKQASDTWKATGGAIVMVTYTIRHHIGNTLADVSKTMNNALRYVHSGAPYQRIKDKYGIVGTISATEILYSPKNGWHYHKHQLLFLKSAEISSSALENWLYDRYEKYINRQKFSSLPGIGVVVSKPDDQIVPEYIAKWGIEDELTAEHKDTESYLPFELLDVPSLHCKFIEYSETMKGKRRLTWSNGLRSILLLGEEVSDEEIAGEVAENLLKVIVIEQYYWREIVKYGLRSEILDLVEISIDQFYEWYEKFKLNCLLPPDLIDISRLLK